MPHLARLEKVDPREIWPNEARDFTSWLAEPKNLEGLGEEIGIDLRLLQTEANVGDFNVDILAEEENTGKKVIIENQLEKTDHDHLGKLITYAAGYDAKIIVWIVKNIREEHRRAIDWLNEHTDEDINLFVVKIELWKIGDSPPASHFQVVSRPNDWLKTIKSSTKVENLTETKQKYLEFWESLKEYAESAGSRLRFRKVRPQHWYDIAIGSSDAHLSFTWNTRERLITCQLYIPHSKDLFDGLIKYKDEIEQELGYRLDWQRLDSKKASRVVITKEADISSAQRWNEYFDWFLKRGEEFRRVFGKYIKKCSNY